MHALNRFFILLLCLTLAALLCVQAQTGQSRDRHLHTACGQNKEVFHIGGIFSDEASASYFREAVLRSNNASQRILPSEFCLVPSTVVISGEGPLWQTKMICDQLIPDGNYALVLGDLPGSGVEKQLPVTPGFVSSYYHLPLISLGDQAEDTIMERDVYRTVLRLLPHKAHEVEVWCTLLSRLGVTHAVMVAPDNVVGDEYESRLRHCWWRGKVIEQVQFLHWSVAASNTELAHMLEIIERGNYGVLLVYAEERQATILFEEAHSRNMTGVGWTWIVSEHAAKAKNLPASALITSFVRPSTNVLIDEAVTLLAFTFALMLKTTWKGGAHQVLPPTTCGNADDDTHWSKEGKSIAKLLKRGFFMNYSSNSVVAFDALGYRLVATYAILNVQRSGQRRQVGMFNETSAFLRSAGVMSPLMHEVRELGKARQLIDQGLYMAVDQQADLNYALHADEANLDTTEHSLAEALQKKVQDVARELRGRQTAKEDSLMIDLSSIYWPEGKPLQLRQIASRWHLRVVTTESVPFVYVFKNPHKWPLLFKDQWGVPEGDKQSHEHQYPDVVDPELQNGPGIVCPGLRCSYTAPNTTFTHDHCCFGYCIDLLVNLSKTTNFTFDLHLVSDGGFGHPAERHASEEQHDGASSDEEYSENFLKPPPWTGMIGELERHESDMIVAPLSVTRQRNRVVLYTKPFMYPTFSVIMRKSIKKSTLGSFLQPFETSLWISIFLIVNGAAVVIYAIEHLSPFAWLERDKQHKFITGNFRRHVRRISNAFTQPLKMLTKQSNPEVDKHVGPLSLGEATWLSWGIVLSTGAGERLPSSCSVRVFTMVWAGIAMIIVASYTANLAAYLVLDRPQQTLLGIDDPRMRNPSTLFNFSTVKGTDVEQYFKRNVELATMHRFMQARFLSNVEEGIESVRNGSLDAFIWETARLLQEEAHDCSLKLSPGVFGKTQYAIAMRKELGRAASFDWQEVRAEKNMTLFQRTNKPEESVSTKKSSLVEKISQEIVSMHDKGQMEVLDERWIHSKLESVIDPRIAGVIRFYHKLNEDGTPAAAQELVCPPKVAPSPTLGLTSVVDIFILLFVGILIASLILVFEVLFHRYKRAQKH